MRLTVTQMPDFESILRGLEFTEAEKIRLGEVIPNGITERIVDGTDRDGEPLPINSARWLTVKRNTGGSLNPLQYLSGRLTIVANYNVILRSDGVIEIKLIPSLWDLHRELIDLSERTGKRYDYFWGIHEDDIEIIMRLLKALLFEKIRLLNSS